MIKKFDEFSINENLVEEDSKLEELLRSWDVFNPREFIDFLNKNGYDIIRTNVSSDVKEDEEDFFIGDYEYYSSDYPNKEYFIIFRKGDEIYEGKIILGTGSRGRDTYKYVSHIEWVDDNEPENSEEIEEFTEEHLHEILLKSPVI